MRNDLIGVVLLASIFCSLTGAFAQDMSNPQTGQIAPLDAPLHLNATVYHGAVCLGWRTATLGRMSYIVERSTVSGGPYSTTFPVLGNASGGIYTDRSVNYYTTYYYVVVAVNAAGTGSASEEIGVTPVPAPEPPSSLSAMAGDEQIYLSWSPSVGARSYMVRRTNVGSRFSPGFSIQGGSSTTYIDRSVTNGITYYYHVMAVGAGGMGPSSAPASTTPAFGIPRPSVFVQPLPQTDLNFPPELPVQLHSEANHGWVYLHWRPVLGATSYIIKRSTVSEGGPYSTTFLVPGGTTTYIDRSAIYGITYYYRVDALGVRRGIVHIRHRPTLHHYPHRLILHRPPHRPILHYQHRTIRVFHRLPNQYRSNKGQSSN